MCFFFAFLFFVVGALVILLNNATIATLAFLHLIFFQDRKPHLVYDVYDVSIEPKTFRLVLTLTRSTEEPKEGIYQTISNMQLSKILQHHL